MIGGIMRFPEFIESRVRQRRADRDYFAVDHLAGRLYAGYWQAVHDNENRQRLAEILISLAGCELVMSRLNPAMGWGEEPDEDGCTVGESCRRSGLLLQEVAYAAGDEPYRGVRAVEFQRDDIAEALRNVALAYQGWAPNPHGNHGVPGEAVSVGQRLDELWHTVVDVIGGQAAEILGTLTLIHGCDPYQCDCDKHHGYTVETS